MNSDRIHASSLRTLPSVVRYFAAFIVVALCAVARLTLDPWLGTAMPFAPFFLGVAFITYCCGRGPAVISIFLSGAIVKYFYFNPDGIHHWSGRILVVELFFGTVCALLVTGVNTLIKAQAKAIRESEKYFRILEGINDPLLILDHEWKFTYLNEHARATLRLLQPDREILAGQNIWESIAIFKGSLVEKEFRRVKAENISSGFELNLERLGLWLEVTAHPSIDGVTALVRNITEKKVAETALRDTQTRFEALFSQAAVGMAIASLDGKFQQVNGRFSEILGYQSKELCTMTFSDVTYPEDMPDTRTHVMRLLSAEIGDYSIEKRYVRKDGTLIWSLTSVTMMKDTDGNPSCFIGVIEDISTRKKAEEVLEARERELSLIYGNVSDGVFYLSVESDNRYRFLSVNKAFTESTGLTLAHVIGRLVNEVIPEPSLSTVLKNYRKAIEQKAPVSWEEGTFYAAGKRFGVVSVSPVFNGDGECIHLIGTVHDITERKMAEDKFLYQKALLEAVTESVLDGILVVSPKGEMLHMNERFQEVWKFPPEVRQAGSDELALEWAASQTLNPQSFLARIAEIYSQPEREFREEIEMKDGRAYDRFGGPIKRDGIHYGWVWTFRDITEAKLAGWALQATQEELKIHAARLEETVNARTAALRETISELEAFSYSVSHDMRAPLRAMQSFAQILQEDCADQISPEGRDYIRRISGAAERMDRLIQDVLTYSRVSRANLELKPVEVEKIFSDIFELYPSFNPPEAKVDIVPPFPMVLATEAVLMQCFANLIGNGLKFVSPGVLPCMRIWSERAMDTTKVKIFFQDNGVGIAEGAHEVIFGIFQRLNVEYEGTGIGLAIVKKGVERMGGKVGLISAPGKGSLFWLELKIA